MSAAAKSASSERRTRRSWRNRKKPLPPTIDACKSGEDQNCDRHFETHHALADALAMSVSKDKVEQFRDNFLMVWSDNPDEFFLNLVQFKTIGGHPVAHLRDARPWCVGGGSDTVAVTLKV